MANPAFLPTPPADAAWADAASAGLLALPLLAFLANALWLGRKAPRTAAWTATLAMGAAAGLALYLAAGWSAETSGHAGRFPGRAALAWEIGWLDLGPGTGGAGLRAAFGVLLDPLSVVMVAIVACLSFLVHLYATAYLAEDEGRGRFFALLPFFTFAMLGLVVSTNLVQTFFFWELVGAASYLLIGFWYRRPAAVAAAKKAFVMTRFADAFFLMGLLLAGAEAGSFDYAHLNSPAAAAALDRSLFGMNLLSLSTLLLYAGAWGKSAMFPLHGWLPDAMEGPTPVSSLLHSATMVVAGVWLTARLLPLFSAAGGTLALVEATGAFTALFAAVIACAQTDLKRILAFSTLSQLGLMMAALGVGAGAASLFHIFTHAFFKCLLFLSAGVIIHAIHSQDLRAAGGLRKALPLTYAATSVAVLAIAGVPPFSGFFSKEEILLAAWAGGHPFALGAGLLTGGLTAFYMARYFLLVFHGPPSADRADHGGTRGEGRILLLPILLLAVPSALAGWLARDAFASFAAAPGHPAAPAAWLPYAAVGLAALGLGTAFLLYGRAGRRAGHAGAAPAWFRIVERRFYVDDLYVLLARRAGGRMAAAPAGWVERVVLNGAWDALALLLRGGAAVLARVQGGQVQAYMGFGLLGLYILYRSARGPG